MSLKTQISEDMKSAMRAKDAAKLGAIRLLQAALKQQEIDERIELDDAQVLAIVGKLIKQRKDSIAQYERAQRNDLAQKEQFEIDVLSAYLPQALAPAQISEAIDQAIASCGASGVADMGKVMAVLKTRLAGRADMAQVSGQVKAQLAS
ncbi:MAG TPA: GatB/YqeY domain-containing protein [Burkholderiaceae bacterium]|mgnify:CR=1 FL=1|nr:GatB/YqeY domain-containing protein [Burkholderiaceae bacterium]